MLEIRVDSEIETHCLWLPDRGDTLPICFTLDTSDSADQSARHRNKRQKKKIRLLSQIFFFRFFSDGKLQKNDRMLYP